MTRHDRHDHIDRVRAILDPLAGPIFCPFRLQRLLAGCWDEFAGDEGGMSRHEAARTDGERRLAAAQDRLPHRAARCHRDGFQPGRVAGMDHRPGAADQQGRDGRSPAGAPDARRIDVQPIAEEIAAAILAGQPDTA